jgi:hypothetical protein
MEGGGRGFLIDDLGLRIEYWYIGILGNWCSGESNGVTKVTKVIEVSKEPEEPEGPDAR